MVYIVLSLVKYYIIMATNIHDKHGIRKISYKASNALEDGLAEILQFEDLKQKKKLLNQRLSPGEEKTRNKINRNKSYMLDEIIFKSIANLLYFFEFVANHPLAQHLFEKDIRAMFGMGEISNKYFKPTKAPIISELIHSALLHRDFGPRNFRMVLLDFMQYTISQQISLISSDELNDEVSTQIVTQDMGRALAWVRLFVQRALISDLSSNSPKNKMK